MLYYAVVMLVVVMLCCYCVHYVWNVYLLCDMCVYMLYIVIVYMCGDAVMHVLLVCAVVCL